MTNEIQNDDPFKPPQSELNASPENSFFSDSREMILVSTSVVGSIVGAGELCAAGVYKSSPLPGIIGLSIGLVGALYYTYKGERQR